MTQYSIEPRTRKYVRGYGFSLFAREYKNNYWIQDQMLQKKVVHKAVEFTGNKIADAETK